MYAVSQGGRHVGVSLYMLYVEYRHILLAFQRVRESTSLHYKADCFMIKAPWI